jgi:hypothetical protein
MLRDRTEVKAMTRVIDDVTAGRRARQIHETPDAALPILDPTDPRYGHTPEAPPAIEDPTDPRWGGASADRPRGGVAPERDH